MTIKEVLSSVKLFNGLTDDELAFVAENCTEESVSQGDVIIAENDAPRMSLFIVSEGEIAISTGQPDSSDGYLLTTMGPGDVFGEMSLVDDNPHSATVRAMSDAKYLSMPARAFHVLVKKNKNIGYVVMRNIAILMCDRLRNANFTIKHFGYFGISDEKST